MMVSRLPEGAGSHQQQPLAVLLAGTMSIDTRQRGKKFVRKQEEGTGMARPWQGQAHTYAATSSFRAALWGFEEACAGRQAGCQATR